MSALRHLVALFFGSRVRDAHASLRRKRFIPQPRAGEYHRFAVKRDATSKSSYRRFPRLRFGLLCAGAALLLVPAADVTAQDISAGLDLFESRIRPVLIEHCYKCHSADSEELEAGLRLDSRAGLLRGGDGGAAIKPGDVAASRLIEAIRYSNEDFEMPPDGKLPKRVIADFEAWVKLGAPWPKEQEPAAKQPGTDPSEGTEKIDWDKARQ